MKKIVTIGGGSGQSELLRGLRQFPNHISAIVSVSDSGGSSGMLRKEYGILPPGDIRRCIVALSEQPELVDGEWNARNKDGHAIGNLALLKKVQELGSMQQAIDWFANDFGVTLNGHQVVAVSEEQTDLFAELEDGTIVATEEEIDEPELQRDSAIKKVWLDPEVETTDRVKKIIQDADMIVLSMGDLFTSLIPNLLVSGVSEAIAQSNAHVVLVANRSNKASETVGFSIADVYKHLMNYMGDAQIHTIVLDDGSVPHEYGSEPVRQDSLPKEVQLVMTDLTNEQKPANVDGVKAARAIQELCTSL